MFYVNNNVLYVNIDSLLSNSIYKMTEIEFLYCRALTSIFLNNLGFGNVSNTNNLDNLKIKFNLSYNSIDFIYKGIEYIINYSVNSKKHGKILGLKLYDTNYNRPVSDSIIDYDVFYDLRFLKNCDTSLFDEGIDFLKLNENNDNIRLYRSFLDFDYKLNIEEIFCDYLRSEYVSKQKNISLINQHFHDNLKFLGLNSNSFSIDSDNLISYGGFISPEFKVGIKVIDKSGYSCDEYKRVFLKHYASYLLNFYINIFVINFLNSQYNRKVNINLHLLF